MTDEFDLEQRVADGLEPGEGPSAHGAARPTIVRRSS